MQPRVSLDQWRTLVRVAESGSFARAAASLHRSQSSVSYAIARLQEQLGTAIFRMEGRRAVLTEAGQALLLRAQNLLREAQSMEAFAHSLEQGWEAEIQLVVDAAFPTDLLMQVLRDFRPISQGTRVQLTQVVMSGGTDAIEEGWADIVISGFVPPGFLGDSLLNIEFVAVAHPEHALHQLDRELAMEDLETELQVIISDSGVRQKRDSGWLTAEQRWSVTSIDNAFEAIQAGLGFCWLPRHRIRDALRENKLKVLPLREGQTYPAHLYLVMGKQTTPGPATQALAKLFKQQARAYLQ